MEYRRLGRTGLKVSELCLGTMQWGWTADETDLVRGHGRVRGRRRQLHRHGRRLLTLGRGEPRRRLGRDHRPVDEGARQPAGHRAGDQGARPDVGRAERRRLEPRSPDARGGRLAAPAADRLHRPVPDALGRPRDAARRDAAGAGRHGAPQARCATSARRTSRPGGCAARCGPARSAGWPATTRSSRTTIWRTGRSSSASSSRCARTRASA